MRTVALNWVQARMHPVRCFPWRLQSSGPEDLRVARGDHLAQRRTNVVLDLREVVDLGANSVGVLEFLQRRLRCSVQLRILNPLLLCVCGRSSPVRFLNLPSLGSATASLENSHMTPEKINVFLLAENRLLREALARILNKKSDVRVVGATGTSPQLLQQVASAGPDVLVSDSNIYSPSSMQIIPELRNAVPGLRIVMIGMGASKETFLRAVRDGIAGYVLKEASAFEVTAAVRAVVNDEAVCPPGLCRTLFDYISSQGAQVPSFLIRHDLGLSRREQQLVQMIGGGLTNKEIASQLNLSEQTVKNHVHRMLRKAGAKNRLGVVEVCRMQGLVA